MVQPVTDIVSTLGEGPIWYNDTLYWVDIEGKRVHSYKPDTGQTHTIDLPERVGTVVPRTQGGLVVALESGFWFVSPQGELTQAGPVVDDRPEIRFNDGKCDPAGRLWAGTMGLQGQPGIGSLYTLESNLSVHKKVSDVTISNGICWSHDQSTMYYIDTPTQQVVAYDYEVASGDITNRRVIIEFDRSEGGPDGMTIDADGNLWIALWGGFGVVCHNPNTGERLHKVDVPCEQVTACTFGGPDLTDLYITTARVGYNEEKLQAQPLAGRLFVTQVGVKGTPAFAFAG